MPAAGLPVASMTMSTWSLAIIASASSVMKVEPFLIASLHEPAL